MLVCSAPLFSCASTIRLSTVQSPSSHLHAPPYARARTRNMRTLDSSRKSDDEQPHSPNAVQRSLLCTAWLHAPLSAITALNIVLTYGTCCKILPYRRVLADDAIEAGEYVFVLAAPNAPLRDGAGKYAHMRAESGHRTQTGARAASHRHSCTRLHTSKTSLTTPTPIKAVVAAPTTAAAPARKQHTQGDQSARPSAETDNEPYRRQE
jgi:hypothetical protein